MSVFGENTGRIELPWTVGTGKTATSTHCNNCNCRERCRRAFTVEHPAGFFGRGTRIRQKGSGTRGSGAPGNRANAETAGMGAGCRVGEVGAGCMRDSGKRRQLPSPGQKTQAFSSGAIAPGAEHPVPFASALPRRVIAGRVTSRPRRHAMRRRRQLWKVMASGRPAQVSTLCRGPCGARILHTGRATCTPQCSNSLPHCARARDRVPEAGFRPARVTSPRRCHRALRSRLRPSTYTRRTRRDRRAGGR